LKARIATVSLSAFEESATAPDQSVLSTAISPPFRTSASERS